MSERAQTYVVPPGTRGYNSQVDTSHAPYNSPPIDYRRSSVDSREYTRSVEPRNYSTPADPAYPYRHDPRRESSDSFYNTGRRFFLHRESMMDLNDSLDPGDGYKSVYTLWGRFAEKTSMQGCAYIYTSRVWYARLLWILLLLAAIGGMIFHLYYLTTQYIAFPKVTKMTLNFSNLPFPAVTICNTNIIRLSQLNKTDQVIQDLVNKTNPKKFNPKNHRNAKGFFPPPPGDIGGDTRGIMPIPGTPPLDIKQRRKRFVDLFDNLDFDLPYPKVDDYEYFYDGDHDNAPPPKDSQSKMEEQFRYLYMKKLDRYKRIEVGHQIEDMLISCSFDGYKCYADNFTVISNEDFGNCFTLQSSFVSTKAGPRSGLSVILYMEGEEYLEGISQGYGARVVVHEQDSFPFPADRGLYLSPSYESHIGVKMTKISREGDPYGKCTDGEAYRQQYGIKYSRLVCQSLCKQNEIFKRCGCYDFISQVELIHFMHGEATEDKFCYTNEQITCSTRVQYRYDKKLIKCSCEDPCYEQDYRLYPSYRIWPTDAYAVVLQQGVCDRLPPKKCKHILEQTDPRALSQNFLKFVIYYEFLYFEVLDEEPEIEDAQFVSDVGGAIGLWIGLSLLAIFEVIQFFGEMCLFGCKVCCRHDDKKYQQKDKKQGWSTQVNGGSALHGPSRSTDVSQDGYRNGAFQIVDFSRANPDSKVGWVYDY